MQIKPYVLPQIQHPFYEQRKQDHPDCAVAQLGWHPYVHQAVLFDDWHNHDAFLLTTKTGSGKTQAAALPVIANRESAFFVYPTNALIKDQQRSIIELAKGMGWKPYVYQAGEAFDKLAFNRADVVLLRVDADNLEKMRRDGYFRTKGQTLLDLLNLGKPTIVLTNPDTLFLILALRYGNAMAVFRSLSQFQTLVIDEFHLYGGVELAHLLFMLHYCRSEGFFSGRAVLLSATPDERIGELLNQIIAPYRVQVDSPASHPVVGKRTVAHPIELLPIFSDGKPVRTALAQFKALRPELERLFIEKSSDDYVPMVIIFNSVMAAMYAADLLREEYHVSSEQVGEYRGLMDRQLRSFEGKLVVVGTSAIEVGVDFKCRYLVFEAGDAASFMQRFGRVGRHEEGNAYLLAPPNVLSSIQENTGLLTRDELEEKVKLWYATSNARTWFVRTESGIWTVVLLAQHLVEKVTADRAATPEIIKQAKKKTDDLLADYATCIKATTAYEYVRKRLRLYERSPDTLPWVSAYAARMAFRTSSVSFRVHDIREGQRPISGELSRSGWYDADLRTLLRRGKNPTLQHDKAGQEYVTIYGYTKTARIRADVQVGKLGMIYSTHDMRDKHNQRVLLTREGKKSKLSDSMMKQDHIFVVVPSSVRSWVDWRISTYYHPRGLLAFDGDALLLKEIYERNKLEGF